MLYSVVKFIVQLSLRAYFKRVDVVGKEYLEEGRAVYVINHPGAMIDPILIAMNVKKPFHYIAGAEWFGKGLKRWIFEDQFNMIPVYRPWLSKGKQREAQNNEDMFRACYSMLEQGSRIMIFPEASSMTVPWIRELKTGAARIKIGGDAYLKEKGDNNDIKVIPVGINYENPHRFQTHATIVLGPPIVFSGMESEKDLKNAAVLMTEHIRTAMQDLVLHMEEEENYPVIRNVIKLMEPQVIKDLEIDPVDPASGFKARKEIVAAVESMKRSKDVSFEALEAEINAYIKAYREEGFRSFNPFEIKMGEVLKWLLLVLVMLPISVVGFVLNGLPYWIAKGLFRSLLLDKVSGEHKQGEINPAFAGSLAYAVGVGVFLVWYILLAVVAANLYTWWVAIPVMLFGAYHSGRVALLFMRWMKHLRDIWHWRMMGEARRNEILAQRQHILRQLNLLKLRYLKERKGI